MARVAAEEADDEGSDGGKRKARRARAQASRREDAPAEPPKLVRVGGVAGGVRAGGPLLPLLALASVGVAAVAGGGSRVLLGAATLALSIVALSRTQKALDIVLIEIDPARRVARLFSNAGQEVAVPTASIRSFAVVRQSSQRKNQRTGYRILLVREDGGTVETLAYPHDAAHLANEAASELEGALEGARGPQGGADGPPPDPLDALRAMRAFSVEHRATELPEGAKGGAYRSSPKAEELHVGWSAQASLWRALAGVCAILGMGLVFAGFAGGRAKGNPMIGAYIMIAVAVVALIGFLWTLGTRAHVAVDGQSLRTWRTRFGAAGKVQRWALADVRAVDLSFASGSMSLVVRTGDGPSLAAATREGDVSGVAGAVWEHMTNGLPLGALTLAEGIQLDLALSSAVAAAKEVDASTV
jgi:hypothetical protein